MTNNGVTLPLTGIAHSTAPSRRPTPGKAAHCQICLLELLLSESEKLLVRRTLLHVKTYIEEEVSGP